MADSKCLKVLRADRVYSIGRNTTSDVVIIHPNISGNHCLIQVSKVDVEVEEITDKDSASLRPLPITLVTSDDDDSEPKLKPRLNRKVKLQLSITDNSSNGTWLYSKTQYSGTNSSHVDGSQIDTQTSSQDFLPVDSSTPEQTIRPRRLERDKQSELHVGDLIFLLAPAHPDAGHYCYRLRQGACPGELVLCQMKPEVVNQITQHMTTSSRKWPMMSKPRTKEESDDKPPDLKRARFDDSVHSKPTDVDTSVVVALHKQLSKELCPHCRQPFTIVELISHVEGCCSKGETSNNAPIDLEQCVYCLEEYPVTELVEHAHLCPKRVDKPVSRLSSAMLGHLHVHILYRVEYELTLLWKIRVLC